MNSCRKGKVGEREFAAVLRESGFDARRGRQFCGSPESPDVICNALDWLHVEVKREQRLNIGKACLQAESDSGGKPWIVAHRRNRSPWLITARADLILALLREAGGKVPIRNHSSTPQTQERLETQEICEVQTSVATASDNK